MKVFKVGDRVIDQRGSKGVILKLIEEPNGVNYKTKFAHYKKLLLNKKVYDAFFKEHGTMPFNEFKDKYQGTPTFKTYLKNIDQGLGDINNKPGKFWTVKFVKNRTVQKEPHNLKPQTRKRSQSVA